MKAFFENQITQLHESSQLREKKKIDGNNWKVEFRPKGMGARAKTSPQWDYSTEK